MRELDERLEETRRSWNVATAAHNRHKPTQGAWLREHGTLFPEERALLGDVEGRDVLHICCNSGQDSLSIAQLGARVTGVDFSDEAIRAARALADESGREARFVHDEAVSFLEETEARFDVCFGSYGFLPWMLDLSRLFRGVARVLRPGGRFVVVELHPMAWSFDARFVLRDPYFAPGRLFSEPVSDYVAEAGAALAPSGFHDDGRTYVNPHRAHAAQHTVADIVTAALDAGLTLSALREWPYSNGCRIHAGLVPLGDEGLDARRFTTPPEVPNVPLMLGLVANG